MNLKFCDRFIPSLELEEADWNRDDSIGTEPKNSEPILVDSDDVFALHSLMKSFNVP